MVSGKNGTSKNGTGNNSTNCYVGRLSTFSFLEFGVVVGSLEWDGLGLGVEFEVGAGVGENLTSVYVPFLPTFPFVPFLPVPLLPVPFLRCLSFLT